MFDFLEASGVDVLRITGNDEELILDDWIAEQEMKGQVVKDRQSVWGFLNQRLQKRRKKRESQWDEIMADDSEE